MANQAANELNWNSRLPGWMHFVLKFAGVYNILAGASMMVFYHEGYKVLDVAKPELSLPIQLVGLLVLLFGIGYLIVDRMPMLNRNVLLLGMMSKTLGPLLALLFIFRGELPVWMLIVLFVADTIYIYPFFFAYKLIGEKQEELLKQS